MSDELIREEAKALKVMHLKLTSGDEVFAIINRNKTDESVMLIEEPLALREYSTEDGLFTYTFKEWMPMAVRNLVSVQKSNIVAFASLELDAKEQYLKALISLAQQDIDNLEPEEPIPDTPTTDTTIH